MNYYVSSNYKIKGLVHFVVVQCCISVGCAVGRILRDVLAVSVDGEGRGRY